MGYIQQNIQNVRFQVSKNAKPVVPSTKRTRDNKKATKKNKLATMVVLLVFTQNPTVSNNATAAPELGGSFVCQNVKACKKLLQNDAPVTKVTKIRKKKKKKTPPTRQTKGKKKKKKKKKK